MKVSRVILIVVALHVLVLGGIIVFEGCSRTRKAPDLAANESLPGDTNAQTVAQTNGPESLSGLTPAMPSATTTVATASVSAPAAPTSRVYTVKKGDSLWKVSKSENVNLAELIRANHLTQNSALQVGQKLQIPVLAKAEPSSASTTTTMASFATNVAAVASATAVAEPTVAAYTVKSGDSLWKIARAHNTSVATIKQANSLKTDVLKVGQKLHISASTPTATANVTSDPYREPGTYQDSGQTVHVVESGETPAMIAKKYGVQTDDLMRANNITDPRRIHFGQKLVIPTTHSAAVSKLSVREPIPNASPALAAPIISATQ